MSEVNTAPGAMPAPPLSGEQGAVEMLRVWVAPGHAQQCNLNPMWEDVSFWGMLLAGVVRDIAEAYGRQGHDPERVFRTIFETFESEFTPAQDMSLGEDDATA